MLFNDNSFKNVPLDEAGDLFEIAGFTIDELCGKHESLLVFPQSLGLCKDGIKDEYILSIGKKEGDGITFKAGNIMGFVGIGNTMLKIRSRFDKDDNDYFLHYMLEKVFSFNIFDMKHSSTPESVFNFLPYLFPYFLKEALSQGLYKEYKREKRNDDKLRGTLDVNRHIRLNIPFAGNIAYTQRVHSFDNDITQLIRHTIQFILEQPYGEQLLQKNDDIIKAVDLIISQTPSYKSSEQRQIIQKNLRPSVHPYFTKYAPLQKLCIQILRMEEIKYGRSKDRIYGLLFDGAWLWEEYLNTLLKKEGFKHPENKKGTGGFYMFTDNSGLRFPDFYKTGMVLDAKYKPLDNQLGKIKVSGVPRDDIHQVVSYMHVLKASRGGFIYPQCNENAELATSELKGDGGLMTLYGFRIPTYKRDYKEFVASMVMQEQQLVLDINKNQV